MELSQHNLYDIFHRGSADCLLAGSIWNSVSITCYDICHRGYADCLLAGSGWNSVSITCMTYVIEVMLTAC
jgi:hypothetical protein